MEISINKGLILQDIFNNLSDEQMQNDSRLKKLLEVAYTVREQKPKISIEGNTVNIVIADDTAKNHREIYKKMVELAQHGEFEKAQYLTEQLIMDDCSMGEVFSFYGQMLIKQGKKKEAVRYLNQAIQWNPNSYFALKALAGLYLEKKDTDRAILYFDEAINQKKAGAQDILEIANQLMKSGEVELAEIYFDKSLASDPSFPEALYGKALILQYSEYFTEAFNMALKCIQETPLEQKSLRDNTLKLMADLYQEYASIIDHALIDNLEQQTDESIQLIANTELKAFAQLELADENKPNHTIQFNPKKAGYSYHVVRELVQLQFILEANHMNEYKEISRSEEHYQKFLKRCEPAKKMMVKGGVQQDRLQFLLKAFFEGVNKQLVNFPLHLFIEQYIYDHYEMLQPLQCLSLLTSLKQNTLSAIDPQMKEITPIFVRDANISMIYVQLLQFKALYGIDLTGLMSEKAQFKQAQVLYEDYLKMKDDREPGEEYDLSEWWAQDLNLKEFFQLEKVKLS